MWQNELAPDPNQEVLAMCESEKVAKPNEATLSGLEHWQVKELPVRCTFIHFNEVPATSFRRSQSI